MLERALLELTEMPDETTARRACRWRLGGMSSNQGYHGLQRDGDRVQEGNSPLVQTEAQAIGCTTLGGWSSV